MNEDRVLYLVIRQYKIDHDGLSPSLRELAKEMGDGWNTMTVTSALARLTSRGLLSRDRPARGRKQKIILRGEKLTYVPPPVPDPAEF